MFPRKFLVSSLISLLAIGGSTPDWGMAKPSSNDAQLEQDTRLADTLSLPGGTRKVSLSTSGENVRTVLHDLSQQGGFNLMMDDSVSGAVSVELSNVTIQQAVQAVAAMADLWILPQDGGIYLVISRQAAMDKGLNRGVSKVIQVHYSNANRIANILNKSLFASTTSSASGSSSSGSSNSSPLKVKGDPRTNTVIVVGTAREIV